MTFSHATTRGSCRPRGKYRSCLKWICVTEQEAISVYVLSTSSTFHRLRTFFSHRKLSPATCSSLLPTGAACHTQLHPWGAAFILWSASPGSWSGNKNNLWVVGFFFSTIWIFWFKRDGWIFSNVEEKEGGTFLFVFSHYTYYFPGLCGCKMCK